MLVVEPAAVQILDVEASCPDLGLLPLLATLVPFVFQAYLPLDAFLRGPFDVVEEVRQPVGEAPALPVGPESGGLARPRAEDQPRNLPHRRPDPLPRVLRFCDLVLVHDGPGLELLERLKADGDPVSGDLENGGAVGAQVELVAAAVALVRDGLQHQQCSRAGGCRDVEELRAFVADCLHGRMGRHQGVGDGDRRGPVFPRCVVLAREQADNHVASVPARVAQYATWGNAAVGNQFADRLARTRRT